MFWFYEFLFLSLACLIRGVLKSIYMYISAPKPQESAEHGSSDPADQGRVCGP